MLFRDIDKDSVEITILSSAESEDTIQLKTGVFFREVLAGCVCSDDVSQTIKESGKLSSVKVLSACLNVSFSNLSYAC
jgi:hypothetical protein